MTQPDGLRTVLVAGGGITALAAAAALKRRAPFLEVTLLATPPAPNALADRIECVLPSLIGFHDDLALSEDDAVVRTGAGYRLGTRFTGWVRGNGDYVHAYGRYGRALGPTSFHLHWLRAARAGAARPFDAYAPAVALARDGRFAPAIPETMFAEHEHGLTLDLARYAAMLRAFAAHVGVAATLGAIAGVAMRGGDAIDAVALADGRTLAADLYVDATGPAAALRGAIDDRREDWSRWLPCDRVMLAAGSEPPLVLTEVAAHPAGWRWSSGTRHGVAYAAACMADDEAAGLLREAAPDAPIALSPGTRPEPWRGNVVAIGDAATQVEPLEWCNLHLALSAIDRLLTMLPGRDVAAVEAADFNRQTHAEANRVRDFLAMHWLTARRDDPLWQDVAATEPPPGLAHTLSQWRERGRLPYYEEETFARDSWVAVLIGNGCLPRRIDPLVDAVPAADAAAMMAGLAAGIAAALPRIPFHADYRAAQTRRLTA